MGRPALKNPKYGVHVSGQAVVYIADHCYYLGKYDSPESWAKYYSLLAEYRRTGRAPEKSFVKADSPILVAQVVDEFVTRRVPVIYGSEKSAGQKWKVEKVAESLKKAYGQTPIENFGPRMLAKYRDLLVASGNSRLWVNEQIRIALKIFQYGVSREIVDEGRLAALKTLEPLKNGETSAPEPKGRQPVPLGAISKTIPHLSPMVAGLIRLQLATGARPGELFRITPGQIDQSGETWMYRPVDHKTAHHNKLRVIALNGEAQAVLEPFMDRPDDEPCFSPSESAQWWRDKRRAERVTPDNTGNRPGFRRGERGSKTGAKGVKPGQEFKAASYRQAIIRACEKAGVEPWTPYQIRHTTATEVADTLGLAAATALLGHSAAAVTKVYTKTAEAAAIEASKAAPKLRKKQKRK